MRRRCRGCCVSVSPLICPLSAASAEVEAAPQVVDQDNVVDLKKEAVLGDLIVGVESVTLDARGQGALPVRILPSPKEPTQAEIDRHNVLHFRLSYGAQSVLHAAGPTTTIGFSKIKVVQYTC